MARRRSTPRRKSDPWADLARKRRWTAEEARSILQAHARCNKPLAAFAREHGLALPRLYAWRQRLSEAEGKGAAAVAPRFLPVRIVSTGSGGAAQPSEIEIVLGNGRRIRVAETFDPEALGRAIDVLERAC